jgi:hypothetical protein
MSSTVVSCYYKLQKAKTSHSNYDIFMTRLFANLNKNVNFVIFTSNDLHEYMQKKTENMKNVKIITKDFDDIYLFNKYRDIWDKQYELDMGKHTGRGIGTYVLWNSKLDFLKEACELNYFHSDKFVWMDIGMIRNNDYTGFLESFPVYENISNDKIDIALVSGFKNMEQKFFQNEVHFSGAIYGGRINTLEKFHKLYYEKFDEYLKHNKFIGCDQQIISSVYLENKELFNPVNNIDTNCIESAGKSIIPLNHLDIWFYLIYYYSQ